ncbi:MAG: Rpp14/Pop5 family protein [Promethearchaeota archaeon]
MKKERQRYILFKIIREQDIVFEQKEIINAIWHSIWRYFGMKEANKIGLWLIELNLEKGYGIIRCSHQTKYNIISALSLVSQISGKRVIFSPLKTSGTIKSMIRIKKLIMNKNKRT